MLIFGKIESESADYRNNRYAGSFKPAQRFFKSKYKRQ